MEVSHTVPAEGDRDFRLYVISCRHVSGAENNSQVGPNSALVAHVGARSRNVRSALTDVQQVNYWFIQRIYAAVASLTDIVLDQQLQSGRWKVRATGTYKLKTTLNFDLCNWSIVNVYHSQSLSGAMLQRYESNKISTFTLCCLSFKKTCDLEY
jgi:hypothetical protein